MLCARRFSCKYREYKYFIVSGGSQGELDIAAMRKAASLLVGAHDFRFVCACVRARVCVCVCACVRARVCV